ncbi:hypothetical protein CASFOL_018397 [Castilleja foliolosa]|uniref:Reverse transcriptase domain-containing protein n=1 Tax=Castilleja foliolosa TaxID=1961234 RepID=A0ABD3D7Z4_9LAMI
MSLVREPRKQVFCIFFALPANLTILVKVRIISSSFYQSPGPDGFNFKFIKDFWDVLEDDIERSIIDFFENASFVKGINSTFITLIPKVRNPTSIREFRPISLIGGLYKIIAKLLALRMARVVESIISQCQFAFVRGRNILESNIIVNEVVDETLKKNKSIFLFKIDFEKAYDSIDHVFLLDILKGFGFDKKWCNWIKCCVSSASSSVIINGSPSSEFSMEKGLRQGDPMSPFLFLLVAECLGLMVQKAVSMGRFRPVRVGKKEVEVSMLQFADDTLFIGEANNENIFTLKSILRMFELWSGLRVNYNKSCLYGINVNKKDFEDWSGFLNCNRGTLPFDFLGLKVGASFNRRRSWEEVENKLDTRIKSWEAKNLSFGGRIVLANAVLNAIPTYYLSIHRLPGGVCRKLRSKIRNFLWGGSSGGGRKISWVSWEKMCLEKDNGGLGIIELDSFNKALLCKWGWRILERSGSVLWLDIIDSKYGNLRECLGKQLENRNSCKFWSSWWYNLIKVLNEGNWFLNNCARVVGNGKSTLFWHDSWYGGIPLKIQFPRLFSTELVPSCCVADRMVWVEEKWHFDWKWRRKLFEWEKQLELELEKKLLTDFSFIDRDDAWKWKQTNSGFFSVKSAYKVLREMKVNHNFSSSYLAPIWVKGVPLKVKAFSWKLIQGGLKHLLQIK